MTGAAMASPPSATDSRNLPLAFVKQGARYLARGQGYFIGLDGGAATIHTVSGERGRSGEAAVSVSFAGGRRTAAIEGRRLSGVVNYISGDSPKKWQIGLPTVDRVTYPEVYRGIDVVYYGNQQQLEFDLVLKPGADPRAIRMKVQGGGKLAIDGHGALTIGGVDGLRIGLPGIYQDLNGVRKAIAGHFAIRGNDEVAFQVENWDRRLALIIDPTIVYSTLLGGGLGSSSGQAIAVDSSHNVLIAGNTTAADFPTVNAASDYGPYNGFVSKLNTDGTGFIYSTFFGGGGTENFRGMAVDSAGSAWVTGFTNAFDFPLVNAAQSNPASAFVAKLDQSGVPQFSTYLGNMSCSIQGIAVDPGGNAYVTGSTYNGFPTTAGALQSSTNGSHSFVAKYSPSGAMVFSTMLGGSGQDYAYGIAADSNGDAYVTGITSSSSFVGAPAGGAQSSNAGNGDAFVTKLKSDGSALLYFTFLGGSSSDAGTAVGVDASLNAYIAGTTSSTGLATTGAAQTTPGGATDGFIAKLNPAGNAFSYITYLGGARQDYPKSLAIDPTGNVYLTGSTESPDFPLVSAVDPVLGASTSSLYTTNDSGETWSVSDSNIPGAVLDLSPNPAGTSAVAAPEQGIFRTTNGGTTWTQQVNLQSTANTGLSRNLAAPGTIYAAANCCGNSVLQSETIYRSTDDGGTWSSSAAPGTFSEILADPVSASTVYLRGVNFWRSRDGGATWSALTTASQGQTACMTATADGALYTAVGLSQQAGPDIYKSTNQGTSWQPLNVGLPFYTTFYPHCLTAVGNTVYLASSMIYKTSDGGEDWVAEPGNTSLFQIAVSPQNPDIQYGLTTLGPVQESSDGGVTWQSSGTFLSTSTLNGNRIFADPQSSARAYAIAPVSAVAFAAKLNKDGSAFAWSTFLGGSFSASGNAIATDGAGNSYITGNASGAGFPLTSQTPQLFSSAFVTKISDATANCAPVLSGGDQTITGSSQTLYFSVVAPSGCTWTASTDAGWATIVSGVSRTGSGPVTVQVATNTGAATRSATLKVGSTSVSISQAANSCSYSLDLPPSPYPADPPAYAVPIGGGNVTAVMTATAGCPWTVFNPYPTAIAITSGLSGTGNGTIQLTVSPSNVQNLLRTFSLPVATTAIRIEQMYASNQSQSIFFTAISDQTLDFAPPPLSATADSGYPVTFTSNTPSVCQVSGTTVTLIAVGTCSITATQPGNILWLAAPPVTRTFNVTAGPAIPQPTGGIANAASAGAATPSVVSIGSYVAIYGHALAGNNNPSATTLPLPASLNGTQATLGGLSMPLLYAVSGQINALVPMGLKPGQSYPLVVTRDNIPSAPVSLTVLQLQPGIYTVTTTGSGSGIVTNALTGQLITQSNPAKAGDYLTIWCTGLGPVHGPNGETGPADGAAPPAGLIYYTNATLTASIQGINAPVLFSGLAPGFAALYQVNIQVPSIGVQEGTVYSLTMTARDSQTGTSGNSNNVSVFVK
jgi:uncharacterized protein (TIGR03437 family)